MTEASTEHSMSDIFIDIPLGNDIELSTSIGVGVAMAAAAAVAAPGAPQPARWPEMARDAFSYIEQVTGRLHTLLVEAADTRVKAGLLGVFDLEQGGADSRAGEMPAAAAPAHLRPPAAASTELRTIVVEGSVHMGLQDMRELANAQHWGWQLGFNAAGVVVGKMMCNEVVMACYALMTLRVLLRQLVRCLPRLR